MLLTYFEPGEEGSLHTLYNATQILAYLNLHAKISVKTGNTITMGKETPELPF